MRRTGTIAVAVMALTAAGVAVTAAASAGPDPAGDTKRGGRDHAPTRVVQHVEESVVVRRTASAPERTAQPGEQLWARGDRGPAVRELQARLRQIGWFSGDVTDLYGDRTEASVRGFQGKRGIPVTGYVDQRTLDRLHQMTAEPTRDELHNVIPDPADGAALDPRCRTGRVICVDKSSSSLRWVVDGDVRLTIDARFGGTGHATREGLFSVYRKSRDHVSSLYDTSMPFAMFFSGGQAVHYSPDFASVGYAGASHGCVNTRDYDEVAWLYDQVQLGDRVVVYWS